MKESSCAAAARVFPTVEGSAKSRTGLSIRKSAHIGQKHKKKKAGK